MNELTHELGSFREKYILGQFDVYIFAITLHLFGKKYQLEDHVFYHYMTRKKSKVDSKG